MGADRVVRRAARPDLALLRQRQRSDLRETARRSSGDEPRSAKLVAIERGAAEEILELSAIACVVEN